MFEMKVVVVGLGSMGKRRIRLIKQYDKTIEICGIDTSQERRAQAEEMFGISTFESLHAIEENSCDCAFISTSPLSHSKLIRECLQKNMHVFTEINLVPDGYDENIQLAADKGKVLFISSTFLYREEIKYIGKMVGQSKSPMNYIYHIGQYLPDWHPWESYQNYFIGDKRTNGCREIFAIELPWILNTFGDVSRIYSIKGKNTNLAIDYPDNYIVCLEHENGTKGSLIVDVVSRKAVRNLEIYSEDLYLGWNGTPEGLYYYDYQQKKDILVDLYDEVERREGYSSFIVENGYLHEIESFFAQVKDGVLPIYDFEKDKRTLQIIDDIGADDVTI